MAYVLNLKTISDHRGHLTVIEREIPFEIKRVFYIYGVHAESITRGGHCHHRTTHAAVCVSGSCKVYVNDGEKEETFLLDSPEKCLILDCQDWHTMFSFTADAVLVVLASEYYDPDEYIYELEKNGSND